MFCASVSGYRYICSTFITALMTHDRGSIYVEEQELSMFNVLLIVIICLSLYFNVYGTFCTHVAFVSF